jgi:ABC-type multidrug transport system fused ATPase/permease subunit
MILPKQEQPSETTEKRKNPLGEAGFFSKLLFLQQKMHHDLRPIDKAIYNNEIFNKQWNEKRDLNLPLLKALYASYKKEIIILLIVGFFYYVLSFSTPLILNRVIAFADAEEKPLKYIVLIIVIIFITRIAMNVAFALRTFYGDFVALYITTSVAMEIFRKTLKYPILRSKKFNSGKIINLLQVDLSQINTLFDNLLDILFVPFQIAAGIALMYIYVGVSFLAGIGMIIIFAVLQYVGGIYYNKYQKEMMKVKDKRMKATSEMLNSKEFK